MEKRNSFSGSIGFVLAAAGSAVGLGNIWRFPYLAAKDGGGLFLAVYLVLALTFGFTLLVTEVAIGRKTKQGCLTAYGKLKKGWGWLGGFASVVPFLIMPYYCIIGGWVLKYAIVFITGAGLDGVAGDSYLNGVFTGNAVHVIKTGTDKLTMGLGFAAPEGSTINVNEGVFAMDAGVTYAQYSSILTIASGVAFAGEGVFGTVNLSVNDVVVPDVATFTDKTATYPILTATSFSGTSANVTTLLNTLNANEKSGSWRVRAVPTGNGAYTLTIVYAKSGFMIIFK